MAWNETLFHIQWRRSRFFDESQSKQNDVDRKWCNRLHDKNSLLVISQHLREFFFFIFFFCMFKLWTSRNGLDFSCNRLVWTLVYINFYRYSLRWDTLMQTFCIKKILWFVQFCLLHSQKYRLHHSKSHYISIQTVRLLWLIDWKHLIKITDQKHKLNVCFESKNNGKTPTHNAPVEIWIRTKN